MSRTPKRSKGVTCDNKIDLAPYVGASLEVMERDAKKMRGPKPFVFTNLKQRAGLGVVIDFIAGHLVRAA